MICILRRTVILIDEWRRVEIFFFVAFTGSSWFEIKDLINWATAHSLSAGFSRQIKHSSLHIQFWYSSLNQWLLISMSCTFTSSFWTVLFSFVARSWAKDVVFRNELFFVDCIQSVNKKFGSFIDFDWSDDIKAILFLTWFNRKLAREDSSSTKWSESNQQSSSYVISDWDFIFQTLKDLRRLLRLSLNIENDWESHFVEECGALNLIYRRLSKSTSSSFEAMYC